LPFVVRLLMQSYQLSGVIGLIALLGVQIEAV
jgi:hypothetical protein